MITQVDCTDNTCIAVFDSQRILMITQVDYYNMHRPKFKPNYMLEKLFMHRTLACYRDKPLDFCLYCFDPE